MLGCCSGACCNSRQSVQPTDQSLVMMICAGHGDMSFIRVPQERTKLGGAGSYFLGSVA